MIELNSLPVSGGALLGALVWAGVSVFALGPIVADRSIEKSHWPHMCQTKLTKNLQDRMPQQQSRPSIGCKDVMGILGHQARQFCDQGGNALMDLMTIDPLAGQKERLRQREINRLKEIAANAPSRCSCAASVVASDRVTWGLYAGSARLLGGPKDLQGDLTRVLNSPTCKSAAEAVQ